MAGPRYIAESVGKCAGIGRQIAGYENERTSAAAGRSKNSPRDGLVML